MNQAVLRGLSAAFLTLACAAWSPAQEEAPKPQQPPAKVQDAKPKQLSKADPEAKAKAKQEAKARQAARTKAYQDAKVKASEKKAQARNKAAAEARARAVDVNHATKEELQKLPGITEALAAAIIAKRPYRTKADLVVKNAIPMDLYQTLRKQVKVAAK
jgi:DNA uptake protein ComE-like DNA-binding protein